MSVKGTQIINEQLGDFHVKKLIGHGAMASVYLAFDMKLERRVALKIPDFKYADNPVFKERFTSEAKAMAKLKNRTAADALKDVRLALLFAMNHNFRARGELIRTGQIRVMDKVQLQAIKDRLKKGEISEPERASMPSYISADEWNEETKMAELMHRELTEARFSPDEERVIRERLEILTHILSRPLSLTMTQLVRK